MSNLIFKQNSKNQIGVGTNKIELTNSQSSALNIKKNDGSYSFLEFNTSSNTIGVGTKMETNALITFKNTTKINSITKGELIYLDSTGNWAGLGTTGIGSYIQVNSGGSGLQWTNNRPNISLISKSPSHNSTISSNSDNIILTFDEIIIAGSGNIVLTPSSGSAITIDVTNTSLVSFSSNICTINPGNDLDSSGLRYTVTMNQGVIKNSIGNLFEGFSGSEYYFNSKDTTVPNISSLNPAHSSVISSNDANIIITFFETVVAGTGDIVLTPSSGSAITIPVTDSAKVTFGIDTCTINPSNDLDSSGLRYTVTMASGVIKDTSGNNFIGFSGSEYYFDSKDTTSPILSNASSIGTTTDATPTFTFTSTEAGIITSSLGFSTPNSATASNNSITFNTLSNDTYSSQWVKVTDTAGNTSNPLTIPTFTVNANPYGTTDIKYHMWNQNMQTSGETRGYVGYVNISCIIGSKTFYLVNLGGSASGYLYFATDPIDENLSHWNVGSSGGGRNDEHTFKITYNSENSNYTIIPDYSSWVSTTSPFTVDMAIYILYYPSGTNSYGEGIGSKLSTYPNWTGKFDITQVSGSTNKWNIKEEDTNNPLLFAQKDDGTYTVPRDYGYVGMHDSTRDKDNYQYYLSDYNTEEAIITFI